MANYQIHELTSGTIDRDSNVIHDTLNGGNYETRKATAGAVADLANVNVAALYDSSHTYNTGDRVIYEGVLYVCNDDNVTGAWDSTKWDNATIDEIISALTAADIPYSSGVSVADKLDNVPTFDTLTTGDNNKLLGVRVSGDDISVGAVDKYDVSTGSITAATGATVRSAYVKKIDGIVYARFAINVTNVFSSRTTIGTFASGFRPSATVAFIVPASTGINDLANRSVSCLVGSNGDIIVGDYCSSSGVKEVSALIAFPVTVT